jgi:hypothetical protein
MRKLALAVIVIQSAALIFLAIYAKMQTSRASINGMAAAKQQELLIQEKERTAKALE